MSQEALNISAEGRCLGCFGPAASEPVCPACGFNSGAPGQGSHVLPPGTILREQYVVGRVLGVGGFGITYLGWDSNLSLKIAIKEYFPSQWAAREHGTSAVSVHSADAADAFRAGLERFLDEGRTLARFHDTPGIVAVLNFFRENNTGYLVMSYVDGITLKQYLEERSGKIPFDTAVRILMPVMDALAQVHEAGVLHRDISPDNIYISTSGQVKLLDFGAARMAPENQQQSLSVIYKPGFAPPEQYMSQGKQGRWTDVYALAATLYRSVTGLVPSQSVERFYKDDLAPPSSLGIPISPQQEAALLQALSVDFAARFQSMRDFQQALLNPAHTMSIPGYESKRDDLLEKFTRRGEGRRGLDAGQGGPGRVGGKGAGPGGDSEAEEKKQGVRSIPRPQLLLSGTTGRVLGILLVVAIGAGAFLWYQNTHRAEALIEELMVGRWEMPRSFDGLQIGAHWKLEEAGTYTIDFIFKDEGEFLVSNGVSWSTTSSKNPPRSGHVEFQDANTIALSDFFVPAEPKVVLKRRNPIPDGKKHGAYSLIGIWEGNFQNLGFEGKRVLTIGENGQFELVVVAHGSGTFEARRGLYRFKTAIGGVEEHGTYAFMDPGSQHPNHVRLTGHTIPLMEWERTLE